MNILGISCHYHDAAAALLQEGRLVAAAEEERFSRKKHDSDFPVRAIRFCLDRAGLSSRDLDYVVFYEKPFLKFHRILTSVLAGYPATWPLFRKSMYSWIGEKLWVESRIRKELSVPADRILFSEHHISHAASAFLCSPFQEAAIMTVDGVGEWASATLGVGRTRGSQTEIDVFQELRFPHSVGLLYSVFTAFLGFEVNEGEYKVMGMAPFGKPRFVDQVLKLIELHEDGSFTVRPEFFSYPYHTTRAFTSKFVELFGSPRNPRDRFVTSRTSTYDDPVPPSREEIERNQRYADIAASIQAVTEKIILMMARHLRKRTGLDNVCIAGGVGLNSVANSLVLREGIFKDMYVQPAAGDSGGALGAALYAWSVLLGKPRFFTMNHAYWGQDFPDEAIRKVLLQRGAPFHACENEDALVDRCVRALAARKVVGWFQGRFEWGPRALGHRSILANPMDAKTKDVVNIKIKFREPFRPFAPSVLEEEADRYFELPHSLHGPASPARFMLCVVPARQEVRARIPAVVHEDGTSRVQTVAPDTSPLYHRLIRRFGEAEGTPVLLNTSFNLRGEPIVTTVENALSTFYRSGIDCLGVGPFWIEKNP